MQRASIPSLTVVYFIKRDIPSSLSNTDMASIVANKVFTSVFVRQESSILLGLKKRGFGEGKWNGFGGKVEEGEEIIAGARRELQEECGITCDNLKEIGILMFEVVGNPQLSEVHVFATDNYTGTIAESDEMKPKWFNLEEIPYDIMWADDQYWFPYMLRDVKFYGYFTFKNMTHNDIVPQKLHEVQSIADVEIPKAPVKLYEQ